MAKKIYSKRNSKGRIFYLHGKGNIYYFSRRKGRNTLSRLPDGFKVIENKKTGGLFVKRK